MAKAIENSPGLVARIPVPPGYEEVDVQRKIRVPNKAAVTVTVKELKRKAGVVVVPRRIVVKPKLPPKKIVKKPVKKHVVLIKKPRVVAPITTSHKCTWCGKPPLPGNQQLHDECAGLKKQLSQRVPTVRRCVACDTPLPANSHLLKKYCDGEACQQNRARQASRESYHRVLKHTETTERKCIICGDDISLLRNNRKVCLKPECKQELHRRGAYAYFFRNRDDPAAKQRLRKAQRRYKANRGN